MTNSRTRVFVLAYGDYEKSLLKHSLYKVHDKDLAADLVQTTFLKTWEYFVQHGRIDAMRGFLFHVLNNLIIDEYRKKKSISLDALTDAGFQIEADDTHRLFDLLDATNAALLIPQLSSTYRTVMTMRYVDDMTIQDIAEKTKKSRNTVAVQLHRGVDKLATLFLRLDK